MNTITDSSGQVHMQCSDCCGFFLALTHDSRVRGGPKCMACDDQVRADADASRVVYELENEVAGLSLQLADVCETCDDFEVQIAVLESELKECGHHMVQAQQVLSIRGDTIAECQRTVDKYREREKYREGINTELREDVLRLQQRVEREVAAVKGHQRDASINAGAFLRTEKECKELKTKLESEERVVVVLEASRERWQKAYAEVKQEHAAQSNAGIEAAARLSKISDILAGH